MKNPNPCLFLLFLFFSVKAQNSNNQTLNCENYASDSLEQTGVDSLQNLEKVYLQTDRTIYYPGDSVWFEAYMIEPLSRLPSHISSNLHVELISPVSTIISSRVIRMENGLGHGDLSFPFNLPTGRYRLRAYTNYMRNFGNVLFFTKELSVINPTGTSADSSQEKYDANQIHFYFFPEGGSLVDDVSSKVAFKAVDNLGHGCRVYGRVFSSAGDLITSFRSEHLGMGYFFLRPSPGLRYFAIFRGADSTDIRMDLPASLPEGVNLGVINITPDMMEVVIKTNSQTLQRIANQDLLLRIAARNETENTLQLHIADRLTRFKIPVDELPDGILTLTLSAPGGLPLSERLVYLQKEAIPVIQIKTDKQEYARREPVSLRISMGGDSTFVTRANISLAAADRKLTNLTSRFPRNIASWFLLESDVRGGVEDPSWYFDPAIPDRLQALDILLLTQGWRDFEWKQDATYFPPENGFTISGRLTKMMSKRSIQDSRISLAIIQKERNLFLSLPTDSSGRFKVSGIDLTGEARLIISGIGKKDQFRGSVSLDSIPYNPPPVENMLPQMRIRNSDTLNALINAYRMDETIRKKYRISDTVHIREVVIQSQRPKSFQELKVEQSRSLYETPDYEFPVTDNMYHFINLIELLRGRVAGVIISGNAPDYKIYIRPSGRFSGIINSRPLFLVDGIPTNLDGVLTIPVNVVDRIDILKTAGTESVYGLEGANGVINIITKSYNPVYMPVDYSLNKSISGFYNAKIFYTPQHNPGSKEPFFPDLRNTLFWDPDIRVESDKPTRLQFYNGDNPARIKVIVEGMTDTGIPVTGKAEYEVR